MLGHFTVSRTDLSQTAACTVTLCRQPKALEGLEDAVKEAKIRGDADVGFTAGAAVRTFVSGVLRRLAVILQSGLYVPHELEGPGDPEAQNDRPEDCAEGVLLIGRSYVFGSHCGLLSL